MNSRKELERQIHDDTVRMFQAPAPARVVDLSADEMRRIRKLAELSGAPVDELVSINLMTKEAGADLAAIGGRLRSLGITREMLAETAPKAKPARGVEIFGNAVPPRAKWSCKGCGKRNDSKLRAPLARTEAVACKFCHQLTKLTLDFASPPAATEPAPSCSEGSP